MSIEDTLRRAYDDRLGRLDLPPGDVAAARRTGARMRTRRRWTVAGAAVVVVAVALAGVVGARGGGSVQPSAPLGHWRGIPAPPLTPRAESLGVWTGREAIVIGGVTQVCPPNADCASVLGDGLRDGAAYDPRTNTWRAIPPAPVAVVPGDRLVVANGIVVLRAWRPHGSRWFTYEPDHNRWSRIRRVPAATGDLPSAIGSDVYVSAGRRVAVYDVDRFHWTLLPPDPIRPRLAQRVVTATTSGPVVTGLDAAAPNDGRTPSLLLADVWDGHHWRRLPPSEQLGGNDWTWTGTRMVDPEPFTLDGGEIDNWGRSYPMGGTLDPATGTWGPLPDALVNPPQGDDRGWSLSASDGSWFAVLGQVYDDATGRTGGLTRPAEAPDYGVTGVWAGDHLLAFGGTDSAQGYSGDALSNRAWLWSP
jgi:hypothetical protein